MRIYDLALATAFVALFGTAAMSAAAAAPPPPQTVNMDLAASSAIRSVLAGQFDEGHIAMLQALGHQQAVAATCAGFTIDPRIYSNEFDLIYDDAKGKPRALKAGEKLKLERQATLALGMAFGAQVAISANDHPAFCKAAALERASGKVDHLVWKK